MHIKHHKSCRICGNTNLTEVIDLGEQYIQGAFDHPDSPSPPRRKISNKIVRCDTSKYENACGLIQAEVSVSPEILYRNYWYQSGISQTMRTHLKSIVDEILELTNLREGTVVDIGMNDGTLLRNYPKNFRRVGIDPSDIAAKQTNDLEVINEPFPFKGLEFKNIPIITSIACFYDVNQPIEFVREIKNALTKDGLWVFEVAYWKSMLENLAFDQILTEHAIHYHLAPIEYMLKAAGLKLFRAQKTDTNGGSILCYVTHDDCMKYDRAEWKEELRTLRFEEFEACLDEQETYRKFKNKVHSTLHGLDDFICDIIESGKTMHVYGASTKLNVLLQARGLAGYFKFAAERSLEKIGAKTLTGIQIISEEESRAMKPDYYLVGPYHFKREIIAREKEYLDGDGKLIFPLPKLTLVSKDGEIEL